MFISSKMLFNSNYIKILNDVRYITTNVKLLVKSHYDTLGITPKATQADVKTAYYKLSMLYHPDKNKDSVEASTKFREVTDAYEVLSNVKSRRLYDKGISNYHTVGETVQQREVKNKPPPPTGKTPIYNFDEWSRAHYEDTFAKDMAMKHKIHMRKMNMHKYKNDVAVENVGIMLLLMFIVFSYYTNENHDRNNVQGSDVPSKLTED